MLRLRGIKLFALSHTKKVTARTSVLFSFFLIQKATFVLPHIGNNEETSWLTGHMVYQKSKCHWILNIIHSVLSFLSKGIVSKPPKHKNEL